MLDVFNLPYQPFVSISTSMEAQRCTEKKKRAKMESRLVVRNSALHGAPFWCFLSGESCFKAKKWSDLAWKMGEPFLENSSLFRRRAFFSPDMIMKKKNGSPLKKTADFQNYSPREPFWLSLFSQCVSYNF